MTDNVINLIPKKQLEEVFAYEYCDIDLSFMGFTDIYKHLSMIIPKHFTVIDLGCSYAPQCFYFSAHRQYIGIDLYGGPRFHSDNTLHFEKRIEDFLLENLDKLDLAESFAICSYVPSPSAVSDARNIFLNIFSFYPSNKKGYPKLRGKHIKNLFY